VQGHTTKKNFAKYNFDMQIEPKVFSEEIVRASKSWAVAEALRVLDRVNHKVPEKGYVLFETGYGPSGLPHIGTYMEVVRTKMVQNAFEKISDIPTKLFVVSDDMDGLRKVPENLPNQSMLEQSLQLPLTSVPDPFGKCKSYGHYMNERLREFLDRFEFEYEFKSSTELYRDGVFDKYLLKALAKYDQIMNVMLPSLGEERQKTYSPFLPICPSTGRVLYVTIVSRDVAAGTITYVDEETSDQVTVPVTGGHCKLQWKPDFGMRWAALDVDFEMYGKDHLANAPIYSKICETIGGKPPVQFFYELFLDEEGRKISKSKGNGVTAEQWLKYAPIESLAFYMYQSPRKAKKLYLHVIPKSVDEYLVYANKFHSSTDEEKLQNPAAHVHNFKVPRHNLRDVTFGLLTNIASASDPKEKSVLLGFVSRHFPEIDCSEGSFISSLASYAMNYYEDFVKPFKVYREPSEPETKILSVLAEKLRALPAHSLPEEAQQVFYDVARDVYPNMREFFSMLYEVLLGQKEGPRWGSFTVLYGIGKTVALIEDCLRGKVS
jgi:lysyl-tRNA synthetase class 1